MGHNAFSDLSPAEWKARFASGFQPRVRPGDGGTLASSRQSRRLGAAPGSVDWVAAGAVTPVKDQGQCGSCWAFSSTGALESAAAVATGGPPPRLSEQQLVDCTAAYGEGGCSGGSMEPAFEYAAAVGGLCAEAAYPYTSGSTGVAGACHAATCGAAAAAVDPARPWGYALVASGAGIYNPLPVSGFLAFVAQQPVSVAVWAEAAVFMFFASGVVNASCAGHRLFLFIRNK